MPDGLHGARGYSLALAEEGAPATRVLSTEEAKEHLRELEDDHDTLVDGLVLAAEGLLDGPFGILGRALITQSWVMTRAVWPSGASLDLPLPPVQSVTSVVYIDAEGETQTLAAESYRLVAGESRARLELVAGASWPAVYDRSDAIRVTFVAGYGAAASDVPEPIRQAVRLLVGFWYENAEAAASGPRDILPFGVRALLVNFRRPEGLI
ncbi:head-tail connector protein [Maritimibacter alexandrii]|uniref:head-tail connector protein n=1 Tax=Maritimibacter alexandrii TaxID=2570355 RepID=UPI001486D7F6|nr:head-tail connector protein [Maritimibacter alexandrii]